MQTHDETTSYWRRLLHRWFVQYNPLYLLSASLVLGGIILLSRGLATEGSVYGQIGVAAIAEVYALALIGGAALLTRIGHRRPAVMLAVLTVLYQCDLTLHTEACANLGSVGVWASAGWLALFVVKLYALAWAMKLRLSPGAVPLATLAGFGLAELPYLFGVLPPRLETAVVAVWVSGLVLLYRPGLVKSTVALGPWGEIVLRRALRVCWMVGGVLLSLHVLFWSTHTRIDLEALAVLTPILATRWMQGERRVWGVIAGTSMVVALAMPRSFALTVLVAALVLVARAGEVARALRDLAERRLAATDELASAPYRMTGTNGGPATSVIDLDRLDADARAMRTRLFVGAALALYLAMWTRGWSGGSWPAHQIVLDLLLGAAAALTVWKVRLRMAIAPPLATVLHFVIASRLVPAPHSTLQWGVAAIGLGFVLLTASLATSWLLRDVRS